MVAWNRVSKLVFNAPPADFAKQRTPGVLLATGEFVEGELLDITERRQNEMVRPQLSMRTLLFGDRTFDAQRDVIAVVIDPRK